MLLLLNSKKFRALDNKASEKIKEFLSNYDMQAQDSFMPHLTITKQWKTEDEVLGEMTLSASGENSRLARKNLRFLYDLSKEHDIHCIQEDNKKRRVYIG